MMDYDTVAIPCSRRSTFKMKPSSVSYNATTCMSGVNATTAPFDAIPEDCGMPSTCDNRAISKSKVLLRAARSITKTKSVSGNFIVKTTICKPGINVVVQPLSRGQSPTKHSVLSNVSSP